MTVQLQNHYCVKTGLGLYVLSQLPLLLFIFPQGVTAHFQEKLNELSCQSVSN